MRTSLFIALMLGAFSTAHAAIDSTRYVCNPRDLNEQEMAQYRTLSGNEALTYCNTRGYYHRCMRAKGVEQPALQLKDLKLRPSPFKFELLSEDSEQDNYNGVMTDWINMRLSNVA